MRVRAALALAAGLAGLAVLPAAPAVAHVRTDVAFVSPRSGQRLPAGQPVAIVLAAKSAGGTGSAEFTLSLDRQLVDLNGRVGAAAAFTSLSLTAGKRLTITVDAEPGVHELRVHYAAHGHDAKPDVVRRFTVLSPTPAPTPSGTSQVATEEPLPTDGAIVGSAFSTSRPIDAEPAAGARPPLAVGLVIAAAVAGAVAAFAVLRMRRPTGRPPT